MSDSSHKKAGPEGFDRKTYESLAAPQVPWKEFAKSYRESSPRAAFLEVWEAFSEQCPVEATRLIATIAEWNQRRGSVPALGGADFEGANLDGIDLGGANLRRANLSGARLRGARLGGANLSHVNLERAELHGATLEGANLFCAKLKDARLSDANLKETDLREADLNRASLLQADLRDTTLEEADLEGADFRHVSLADSDLRRAFLKGARLSFAKLEGANLYKANLNGVALDFSNLKGAYLRSANLEGANLQEANLEGTDLRHANLKDTLLRGASGLRLNETRVGGAQFDPLSPDPWSVLRRKYTGPRLVVVLMALLLFALPYLSKTIGWITANQAQEHLTTQVQELRAYTQDVWSEHAAALTRVQDSVGAEDGSLALIAEAMAQDARRVGGLLVRMDSSLIARLPQEGSLYWRPTKVWKLVLGLDRRWLYWLPGVLLILYNLTRAAVTMVVVGMREEEERSGWSPRWSTSKRGEATSTRRWWSVFEAYGWVWSVHRYALTPLFWVAVGSFLWHAWDWLSRDVFLPTDLW